MATSRGFVNRSDRGMIQAPHIYKHTTKTHISARLVMYICVSAFKSSCEVLLYDLENKIISLTGG